MPGNNKINRAQRQAAGYACLTLFSVCNTITHGLKQVALKDPASGIGFGKGLSEKEREYVEKLATDFHDKAEILRKLGWRFRDS